MSALTTMTASNHISFNVPFAGPEAQYHIEQALGSGKHCGNGTYGTLCCELLKKWSGAVKVFLTPSCTSALEMSALLLDIQPGDEVVVPSFTFVSTPCAFNIFGARPVFVDVEPGTINLDARALPEAISERTKAIVPVHYGGVACAMGPILQAAQKVGAAVVEDNAHGLFGSYEGKPLGSFGAASTLSFHETKNFGCGEGGALILNDPDLLKRAEIVQEKGTDRSRFLQGQVDKYTWVDRGSSYLLGEIPAALLYANLSARESVQGVRLRVWHYYQQELRDWARQHGVGQPGTIPGSEHPAHLYYLMMPDNASRQSLVAHLKQRGISAAYHYQPLHLSPMGLKYGGRQGQCPVAENVADCLLRLPLHASLSVPEQERIVEGILQWR